MSTTEPPSRIVVVTAGLSQPSSSRLLADRLAGAVTAELTDRGGRAEVTVVELREWARDLTNQLLTCFPGEGLRQVLDRVAAADAVIAVTPIFSASYSGLFKTFFDVLDVDALRGTPVLIAATGGSARHSLALEHAVRPLFSYLRATVVPTAVYAAPEDWAWGQGGVSSPSAGSQDELTSRIQRGAGELAALLQTRVDPLPAREESTSGDPAGEVIPFARLLAAQRSAAVEQQR